MRQASRLSVFFAFLLVLFLTAAPVQLGGPASYVIVDGRSMEPTYQDGDLVVAYAHSDYDVGDVIVYDAPVDSQFNVIHRIIDTTDGGFVTQGDNRDEPDGWNAPYEEIHGAALFHIPRGGAIVNFLRKPTTILAIGAGWVTLILMERSPKRSDRSQTGSNSFTGRQKPSQTPQRRRRRSNTSVSTIDGAAHAPKMTRATKKAAERTARRKKRSTVATLSLVVLLGGSSGVLFAHAAVLSVDAGVLQTFTERVDIEPPPPSEHDTRVHAHFFDSSDEGKELGGSPFTFEPVKVMAGQSYQVTWNGPPGNSTIVDCTGDEITFLDELPESTYQGTEQVTPEHDADHLLCIQTAPGNVPENITFEVFNSDGVEVELTPSDDESDGDDAASDNAQSDMGSDEDTQSDDADKDVTEEDTATDDYLNGTDSTSDTSDETSDRDTTGIEDDSDEGDPTDDTIDEDESEEETDDTEDEQSDDAEDEQGPDADE